MACFDSLFATIFSPSFDDIRQEQERKENDERLQKALDGMNTVKPHTPKPPNWPEKDANGDPYGKPKSWPEKDANGKPFGSR